LTLFCLLAEKGFAQVTEKVPDVYFSPPKVTGGIILGGNYSLMQGDGAFTTKYNPGITGGFYGGSRNDYLGLRVEVLLSSSRYNLQDTFQGGGYLKTLYLDIPVLFQCKIVSGLWVEAGLDFGTLLSVNQSPSGANDPKSWFQSKDYSGLLGLELNLNKNFSLEARYNLGFTDVKSPYVNASSQSWQTKGIQAFLLVKVF